MRQRYTVFRYLFANGKRSWFRLVWDDETRTVCQQGINIPDPYGLETVGVAESWDELVRISAERGTQVYVDECDAETTAYVNQYERFPAR